VKTTDTRALAAQTIAGVFNGQSLTAALEKSLSSVAPSDRGLLQQLCYGTLREAPRLDAVLESLLERPMRNKDADVLALLMIGLHQLESLRIPDHAAVAETVEATGSLQKPWAKGLTNAVLRRFLREKGSVLAALNDAESASHPAWLYGKTRKQWPDHAASIFEANNTAPPMTLRVNAQRTDRNAYLKRLEDAGIEARAGHHSPQSITLAKGIEVDLLPGFAEGEVSVQDESAQHAAHLLGAQAGERVLDVCSAPGGKTCHILELQPEVREVTALDIEEQRLEKVRQNLERLSLTASVACADALHVENLFPKEHFDRILVDAPCSASGVIRRHPDIKVLREPEDIAAFARLQLQILLASWPLLKAGGTLLYATCSIFREENLNVVQLFCQQSEDARLIPLETAFGEQLDGCLQTLPDTAGGDGLFYARLRKAA